MLHLLSNIEITEFFNYESSFNGVFSRGNLPITTDGTYKTSFDDRISKRTHWVSLFIDKNAAVYFDSFGIEYIIQKH